MASVPAFAQRLEQQLFDAVDKARSPPPKTGAEVEQFLAKEEASLQLRRLGPAWVERSTTLMRELLEQTERGGYSRSRVGSVPPTPSELSLMTDEMVEARILASRTALVVSDKGTDEFKDLRLRIQHLEQVDLEEDDPVRAGVFVHTLVQSWLDAGLTRPQWQICQPLLQAGLVPLVIEGWHDTNHFLLEQGVLPHIDLRQLVRRSGFSQRIPLNSAPVPVQPEGPTQSGMPGLSTQSSRPGFLPSGTLPMGRVSVSQAAAASVEVANRLMRFLSEHLPAPVRRAPAATPTETRQDTSHRPTLHAEMPGGAPGAGGYQSAGARGADGPREPHYPGNPGADPAATEAAFAPTEIFNLPTITVDWTSPATSALGVREQARVLKAASRSDHEKAVIEVVALIFENILAEERIPPSIRVWFARLQMPVLRIAVVDPEFLSSPEHPARLLIDRMGSCVLGFDSAVSLDPLEQEIRRVVQVIEQYPETGRRVFELMHKEFLDFLTRHLHTDDHVGKVVNVARQVEQKETLTVKYTIELRKLLSEVSVRDEVRDFLFQVWVEVLAFASVKLGAQHERSVALRSAASELLWAASAKPNRGERAKVIARLPGLLAQLREGMQLLGYDAARQDAHVQRLSDALTDAFMSRTQPIDAGWLQGLTRALAGLEDYLGDKDGDDDGALEGHFELSADSIELITGVDASAITVLADTPQSREAVTPQAAAAARQLVLGAWYDLEHNGQRLVAQLVWRSRGQRLYLLARPPEQSFLMQAGRLAHYLQAGLLRSCEAEPLTTRATREALDKLSANPERLLA